MPKVSKKVLGGLKAYRTTTIKNFLLDNNIGKKQDMGTVRNWFGSGKTKKEIEKDIRQLQLIGKGDFESLSRYRIFKERLSRDYVGDRKKLKPKSIITALRDDYEFYYDNKKLIIATNKAAKPLHNKSKGLAWGESLYKAANKVKDKEGFTLHQRHEAFFEQRKNNTIKKILEDAKRNEK